MKLLVNALSATNLSGRQVLVGHLAQLLARGGTDDRFILLRHEGNRDLEAMLVEELGQPPDARLRVVVAPPLTRHWLGRTLYERLALPRLAQRLSGDCYLTSSGAWTPGLPCPQVTLALNPWALTPGAARTFGERLKAALQRWAYRVAVWRAEGIGYGSAFMRDLYRANAGGRAERAGAIVYPALGAREAAALDALRSTDLPRELMRILCVSLMAPHKNIEALISALRLLRKERSLPARLRLVGGWPDTEYRRAIEARAAAEGVADAVEIAGHLPREALRKEYRAARVYALLSRSESFGIPSVEAQRVGTPVVAARECAAPEVCGEGGWYVAADDVAGAADRLARLLTQESEWAALSAAAVRNAMRFEYRLTSRPLLELLRTVGSQSEKGVKAGGGHEKGRVDSGGTH